MCTALKRDVSSRPNQVVPTSKDSSDQNLFAGTGGLSTTRKEAVKKKGRKKISKSDISGPSNFV